MCIGIVDIGFGIANGQILTEVHGPAQDTPIFLFLDTNLSKFQGILTKFGTCIGIKEIWFGVVNGQILSVFDSYL